MVIRFKTRGSFQNTERYLRKLSNLDILAILNANANLGTDALALHTPKDSGLAADSWGHKVVKEGNNYTIIWTNSDVENGFPVAIMLQYGHGTGTGGYVQGQDYINPAMKPVFDSIADKVWKAVTSA